MMNNLQQYVLLLPEIGILSYLVLGICFLMAKPQKQVTTEALNFTATFLLLLALAPVFLGVDVAMLLGQKAVQASVQSPSDFINQLKSHGYVIDVLAVHTKSLVLAGSALMLIFSQKFLSKHVFAFEFLMIFALLILGQCVTISASDTLNLYLGIELMALSSCGLVALSSQLSVAPNAKEAAVKYIVMGAVASGFLLFGLSFWYGAFGVLDYASIHAALKNDAAGVAGATSNLHIFFLLGFVFIMAGFAFKLGLVPFHAWLPDVYQGASYPVAMILAAVPKIVAFVMFYRFFTQANVALNDSQILLVQGLGLVSIIFANLLGVMQVYIRRLLAYSTIGNMGFMVLILGLAQQAQTSIQMIGATALYYIVVYGIASLLFFAILMQLPHNEKIEDLKGLAKTQPKIALALGFLILSMMGIPPFLGFYPKLATLQILINQQQYILAVFAILATVIAAFYYLRLLKTMYFDAPEVINIVNITENTDVIDAAKPIRLPLTIIVALFALLWMMLLPTQLLAYFKAWF